MRAAAPDYYGLWTQGCLHYRCQLCCSGLRIKQTRGEFSSGEERDRSIVATLFLPPSTFRWLAFLLSPHVSGVSVSRGREGGTPTPHLQRHENPALAVAGK